MEWFYNFIKSMVLIVERFTENPKNLIYTQMELIVKMKWKVYNLLLVKLFEDPTSFIDSVHNFDFVIQEDGKNRRIDYLESV
jgi:hypothetical protein